jgi:hypothetical protein
MLNIRVLRGALAITAIACAAPLLPPSVTNGLLFAQPPKPVTMLGYQATAPAGWSWRTPSSSMRLAEYVAGAPGGAEVVVYYFGPSQGGTVDANLQRWKAQFSNPDGKPVTEKISHEKTGVAALTIAEYRGTYARGVGAGSAPDEAKPGQILIAVVSETPKGTLFFQMFGPAAAVEAQRANYLKFARSLK